MNKFLEISRHIEKYQPKVTEIHSSFNLGIEKKKGSKRSQRLFVN